MPKKDRSSAKGFVEEMRAVAMKLHTRDQAKEGERDPDSPPVAKWEPSLQGYLRFLVDSKLVYDTLETIGGKASHPWYTFAAKLGSGIVLNFDISICGALYLISSGLR